MKKRHQTVSEKWHHKGNTLSELLINPNGIRLVYGSKVDLNSIDKGRLT